MKSLLIKLIVLVPLAQTAFSEPQEPLDGISADSGNGKQLQAAGNSADAFIPVGGKPAERLEDILSLEDLGPAAIPDLILLLLDDDTEVRLATVSALKNMGRDAEMAIPALAGLINDQVSEVRSAA